MAMKKLLLLFVILAGCAKEDIDLKTVQLSVEGQGTYLVTYGASDQVTMQGIYKWSTTFNAAPGDTIKLAIQTDEKPAVLYLNVEVEKDVIFWKSMFVESQSAGSLNYIIDR